MILRIALLSKENIQFSKCAGIGKVQSLLNCKLVNSHSFNENIDDDKDDMDYWSHSKFDDDIFEETTDYKIDNFSEFRKSRYIFINLKSKNKTIISSHAKEISFTKNDFDDLMILFMNNGDSSTEASKCINFIQRNQFSTYKENFDKQSFFDFLCENIINSDEFIRMSHLINKWHNTEEYWSYYSFGKFFHYKYNNLNFESSIKIVRNRIDFDYDSIIDDRWLSEWSYFVTSDRLFTCGDRKIFDNKRTIFINKKTIPLRHEKILNFNIFRDYVIMKSYFSEIDVYDESVYDDDTTHQFSTYGLGD